MSKKYFPKGPGAIFTVRLKNGYKACISLVEGVKLLSHVANVGDTRTLVIHPASGTHSQMDEATLKFAGLSHDMIRLSVGIEDVGDLISDLDAAFEKV